MGATEANLTKDGWITARVRLCWWSRQELIDALSTDFYQEKSATEKFDHPEIQEMQADFEAKLEELTDDMLADYVWKMAQRTNIVEDDGDLWIDRYGITQVHMNGVTNEEEGNPGL